MMSLKAKAVLIYPFVVSSPVPGAQKELTYVCHIYM